MSEISIIIPAYGHSHLIELTLASVFQQTYQDFEIIVVNDGSPDETEQVLRPYIENQKIKYFSQKNQGMAVARNVGLSHACGQYVLFLDDDDLIPPDKLEWQLQKIKETKALMIVGQNDFIGKESNEILHEDPSSYVELKVSDFFGNNPIASPGQALIQRKALEEVGGFDASIWGADDLDLWIKISQIGKVYQYQKLVLSYRIHESNASKNIERIGNNLIKVLNHHLPNLEVSHRAFCEKKAFHYVFRCMIKKILKTSIRDFRNFRYQASYDSFRHALNLFLKLKISAYPRGYFYLHSGFYFLFNLFKKIP